MAVFSTGKVDALFPYSLFLIPYSYRVCFLDITTATVQPLYDMFLS